MRPFEIASINIDEKPYDVEFEEETTPRTQIMREKREGIKGKAKSSRLPQTCMCAQHPIAQRCRKPKFLVGSRQPLKGKNFNAENYKL